MDSPERPKRTKKFQQINDAYYTLSAAERRKDYDEARTFHTGPYTSYDDDAEEEIPRPSAGAGTGPGVGSFFNWFGGGNKQSSDPDATADQQFGTVFEEMMNEDLTDREGESRQPNGRFWAIAGTLSGAVLGFIMANVPGAAAGGTIGNRMGALRDKHGQPVYKTFQQLPQSERSKLLTELAAKLFAGALS